MEECTNEVTSTPTDPHWELVAAKGDTGKQGPRGPAGPAGSGSGGSTTLTGIPGYKIVTKQLSTEDEDVLRGRVDCPVGKVALGGGAQPSIGTTAYITESWPTATFFSGTRGWYSAAYQDGTFGTDAWSLNLWVVCAKEL